MEIDDLERDKLDRMSEALRKETQDADSQQYHLMIVSERRYAVIRTRSRSVSPIPYNVWSAVPGLSRVDHETAIRAIQDLNDGITSPENYAP